MLVLFLVGNLINLNPRTEMISHFIGFGIKMYGLIDKTDGSERVEITG